MSDSYETLSIEELRQLHEEHRRAADVLWHAIAARVARMEITGPTWAELEMALQEAVDPETARVFNAMRPGAPPAPERAIENTAYSMCLEGFDETVVAEHVANAGLERGGNRDEVFAATARGIGRARRARRAAA